MDGFFQAGIGLGSDFMNQMASMGAYEHRSANRMQSQGPKIEMDPVKIPEEYIQDARFQPGYDEDDGDLIEVRKMIKEKKKYQLLHNYEIFEEKLEEGILDAPNLNLHQVPPSVFDNNPPVKMMYLKENLICELPEYFFDELPFLAWLDVRDNKLTNLPKLSTRHESLRDFLLQGNQIRALPYTLALAINLRTIGITGNPVTIPPLNIQKQGCKGMLKFLQEHMMKRVPIDEVEEFETLSSQVNDEKLRDDLKQTALKCVIRKQSSTLNASESTTLDPKTEERRRAERLVYTWDLWKRVPYDGPSRDELFKKTLEETKSQVLSKLNTQQEALLQKCKNHEVLRKWRSETKLMQMINKPVTVNPSESAPFGNDLNNSSESNNPRLLRPSEYKKEIEECWQKLKEFSSNPAALSNTNVALKRLHEVEEIHKRLMNAKLVAHII